MINISKKSIVYVVCPAQTKTGGPELLHQLVSKLNKIGINAKMYYFGNYNTTPIHPEFTHYDVDFVDKIDDNDNNVLIVPEINTYILNRYKKIKKVIWWLSIDNYIYTLENNNNTLKNKIKNILGIDKPYKFNDNNKVYHLVQSYYAMDYLKNKNENNIFYLSDYLNKIYFNKEVSGSLRENIVLYNPKKGIEFTKKLIDKAKHLNWTPIENMTTFEVFELLNKSKVYIDFGNHPGKDRFPREAAMCGCCIITGKRGSAKYHEDVPIEDEFKFEDDEKNINLIVDKIEECINNYDDIITKYEYYKTFIRKEESKFDKDLLNLFSIN